MFVSLKGYFSFPYLLWLWFLHTLIYRISSPISRDHKNERPSNRLVLCEKESRTIDYKPRAKFYIVTSHLSERTSWKNNGKWLTEHWTQKLMNQNKRKEERNLWSLRINIKFAIVLVFESQTLGYKLNPVSCEKYPKRFCPLLKKSLGL